MPNDNDPIGFDDEARESWTAWLASFDVNVYPTFSRWGLSRNTALQAFLLNQLINLIGTLDDDD